MRVSLLAARFLDQFRSDGNSAKIEVAGYAIPEGTAMVKCGLCQVVVPRDDFHGHASFHSTVQHTSIEAVLRLMNP